MSRNQTLNSCDEIHQRGKAPLDFNIRKESNGNKPGALQMKHYWLLEDARKKGTEEYQKQIKDSRIELNEAVKGVKL